MATKSRPSKIIQQALEGSLMPLGSYTVRPDGDNYRMAYPEQAAQLNSIDTGDDLRVWVDQETGATVTIPVDSLHDD